MGDKLAAKIYRALFIEGGNGVIELCRESAMGPLHVITVHDDTVLGIAVAQKNYALAIKLLEMLPEHLVSGLGHVNAWGNNVLHNACFSNKGIDFCKLLLQKAPHLLFSCNTWGESPIFQAARSGRMKTFQFLVQEVLKQKNGVDLLDNLFYRADKITILHISIFAGKFDMALMIASTYPRLCSAEAQDGITAFQILVAYYPTAFKSGTHRGFLTELIYSIVSTDQQQIRRDKSSGIIQKAISFLTNTGEYCCICPMIEHIREQKRRHEVASKLTKIFAQHDTSWRNTHKPIADVKAFISESGREGPPNKPLHVGRKDKALQLESAAIREFDGSGEESMGNFSEQEADYKIDSRKRSSGSSILETCQIPLFLAAKTGCVEVMEAILDAYPQALEYLNEHGETPLHVAVKNRHSKVMIELLLRKRLPLYCLVRLLDHNGNSILHVVGSKRERVVNAKLKSPAIQLKDDLRLLEYLKTLCPRFMINSRNNVKKTADELFAWNNDTLRNEAKEWLKRTAEHCTVITVLISTVAFAAAYTVPGGSNQTTGYPVLGKQPFFLIFTACDVLSLAFALAAVVIFLSILTSPFQLKDFRRSLPEKLLLGLTLLFLSVSMMMLAFAATIILTINKRERWTKIAIYSVAFFPVSIFVLSYIPLYVELMESFKFWIRKIIKSLPRCAARHGTYETYIANPQAPSQP